MSILQISIRYFSKLRPESSKLRRYLLHKYKTNLNGCHCSMCLNILPECLLEVAHLKPRRTMRSNELLDFNNVELMCRLCHSLYDKGHIGVNYNSKIMANDLLLNYNHLSILQKIGKPFSKYNSENSKFLEWHYLNMFLK
jgi:hypothetical protein